MIKISRISSPLKDKVKNLETCSQLDGDGVFEGKYKTSGSILIRNKFIGELSADQIIVDEKEIKSPFLPVRNDPKSIANVIDKVVESKEFREKLFGKNSKWKTI